MHLQSNQNYTMQNTECLCHIISIDLNGDEMHMFSLCQIGPQFYSAADKVPVYRQILLQTLSHLELKNKIKYGPDIVFLQELLQDVLTIPRPTISTVSGIQQYFILKELKE